jgi:hypothetical protein
VKQERKAETEGTPWKREGGNCAGPGQGVRFRVGLCRQSAWQHTCVSYGHDKSHTHHHNIFTPFFPAYETKTKKKQSEMSRGSSQKKKMSSRGEETEINEQI